MNPSVERTPKKSTTVRLAPPLPMRALFAGLRAVERTSPTLAARLCEPLMFRTVRGKPSPKERSVIETARAFRVGRGARELQAWRWGTEGPVIVLVHGWNGRATQLGPFVTPLLDAGFQVVAFDAPGHGDSRGSESSLPEFADAIDRVLDAVRPVFGPVHGIIAHSMGGAATTVLMSRYAQAPKPQHERATRPSGLPSERFAFIAPPIDVRDFIHGFGKIVGISDQTEAALGARIEARFGVRLDQMHGPTIARSLHAPLLVVHDEDDRDVPVHKGRALADAWPGARFQLTRGLGHNRILRDPNVIADVVRFMRG